MINTSLISYGCVFKRSNKPVLKGSRVESIEERETNIQKLLKVGWEKTHRFNSLFFFLQMVNR